MRNERGGFAVSLEEISNRNLVYFYREELASGEFAGITPGARRTMAEVGILKPKNARYGRIVLSDLGRKLLEEVKNV